MNICEYCGAEFRREKSLAYHMKFAKDEVHKRVDEVSHAAQRKDLRSGGIEHVLKRHIERLGRTEPIHGVIDDGDVALCGIEVVVWTKIPRKKEVVNAFVADGVLFSDITCPECRKVYEKMPPRQRLRVIS